MVSIGALSCRHLLVEHRSATSFLQLGVLVLELLHRRISVGSSPSYFFFQLK